MFNQLAGAALALALIFGAVGHASAQVVCEDFTGMSSPYPGAFHASSWDLYTGGGPLPPGYFALTNTGTMPGTYPPPYDSANFWIVEDGGEELVYHPGTPGGLAVEPYYMGVRATYFSVDIYSGAGSVTVTAYGANNVIIFQDTGIIGSHSVVISGKGTIHRVEIDGSDDERYFDNICAGSV